MKALITGSTGFVGQNLTTYFSNSNIQFTTLTRFELTIGEFSKLRNCDAVVHLAGKAHDVKNTSHAEDYHHINYVLTRNLFEAFVKSECAKFIFISSVKAYADHLDQPLTEDAIPDPKTPYGISKLRAEQFMQNVNLPQGKSLYILRPCMIHGPGNKGNLNLLYRVISLGLPYPLAAFENKRSFLSVENLCFVISEILTRDDIEPGAYQIADDQALSTNELIKLIGQALNRKAVLWKINGQLIKSVAKLGDIIKLPLNSDRLGKLIENYVVANDKLKKSLNRELPVKAEDGIIKTIRSFNN